MQYCTYLSLISINVMSFNREAQYAILALADLGYLFYFLNIWLKKKLIGNRNVCFSR